MWTYIRHMLCGPITIPVLLYFKLLFVIHGKILPRETAKFNPLVWVFVIVDILYNWTVGTILFLEFPKEGLFTPRVQRHYNNGDYQAEVIARIVNEIDPQHIKTK